MSPTDASRFTDAATFWHPTGHPTPHTGLRSHVRPGPPCQRRRPGNKTQPPGDRSLRHDWARRGVLTPIRSTGPATTLGGGRPPLSGDPHSHAPVMRPMTNDSRALSTVMTATLSADLQGRVPADLVADVVRAVLDESRHAPRDRGSSPRCSRLDGVSSGSAGEGIRYSAPAHRGHRGRWQDDTRRAPRHHGCAQLASAGAYDLGKVLEMACFVQAVALDLDETLARDGVLSQDVLTAIDECRDTGVSLVVVTGHPRLSWIRRGHHQ